MSNIVSIISFNRCDILFNKILDYMTVFIGQNILYGSIIAMYTHKLKLANLYLIFKSTPSIQQKYNKIIEYSDPKLSYIIL